MRFRRRMRSRGRRRGFKVRRRGVGRLRIGYRI